MVIVQWTRIKICGIGRVSDALLAARAGADAIGLVFHPTAKRSISVEAAREIIAAIPPFVTPVGLFVDADIDKVIEVSRELGLRHIQLHGNETPEDIAALSHLTVIKAVRVQRETFAQSLADWREAVRTMKLAHLRGLVLETAHSSQLGGTGIANDWETVERERQSGGFEGLPHLIAAGGLTAQNVADVIRRIRPWAVDVSSGVEESIGIKSESRVRDFVRAVRAAQASS